MKSKTQKTHQKKILPKNKTYLVNAYRFGSNEKHSYTIGVSNKKHQAIQWAKSHAMYRGRKYECMVEEIELNQYSEPTPDYTKIVFNTQTHYWDGKE